MADRELRAQRLGRALDELLERLAVPRHEVARRRASSPASCRRSSARAAGSRSRARAPGTRRSRGRRSPCARRARRSGGTRARAGCRSSRRRTSRACSAPRCGSARSRRRRACRCRRSRAEGPAARAAPRAGGTWASRPAWWMPMPWPRKRFTSRAVGGVEAHARDRLGDRRARLARGEVRAGGALRELAALALGEVHDVDGREILPDQVFERLVQRRLAVLEVERHRARVGVHVSHTALREVGELLLDRCACCRASPTSAGTGCGAARAAGSATRSRARGRRSSGTRRAPRTARRWSRRRAAPCSRAPRRCSRSPARPG